MIDASRLADLGFRPDDAADTLTLLTGLDAAARAQAETVTEWLRRRIGSTVPAALPAPPSGPLPPGSAYLVGFLAVADEVRAAYLDRGIAGAVADRSMADLGQQVFVHRQAYGSFGLHTQQWIADTSWAGNLCWLGRLQYEFRRLAVDGADDRWWLSVHIPQTGPLDPAAVDASFATAVAFAATYFPDRPVAGFHCDSWLLDPQLAEVVPGSNIAAFGARWSLLGEPREADSEVLFFVFHRRDAVDLDVLPQRNRLERAVAATLRSGGHWYGWQGTCAMVEP